MPRPLRLQLRPVSWTLREPFTIARGTQTTMTGLELQLVDAEGRIGRAESQGVDYRGETPESMATQLQALAAQLHDGLAPQDVQNWLPPGGARHLLDAALWDLACKRCNASVWQLMGLSRWTATHTAVTIGLLDEERLRRRLLELTDWPMLKLKLDATHHVDVVRIARELRPDVRLTVDCNGGFDRALLERCLPIFEQCRVELIEQPLPAGRDDALRGLSSRIPLAADESCDTSNDLPRLAGLYQVANIKLEKAGGLTEALLMARACRGHGLKAMVGTMGGSSLAMAPSFSLAGLCSWVDLDTPLLLAEDRTDALHYGHGRIHPPKRALWG